MQRLSAIAAWRALRTDGFSVYLDPALNSEATPDGDRDAAVRHLDRLAERAIHAETDTQIADVLTEIAAPRLGLPPLTHEVVTAAWTNCCARQADIDIEGSPPGQLPHTAAALSILAGQILRARNYAARDRHLPGPAATPAQPAPAPAPAAPRGPSR